MLLGLVREGDGVAAKVLSNLGIELNKVRSTVEFIIGVGDRIVLGDIGLTPGAKKVIELAVDEARRLNHDYIGTEHLLLGLVREGEGIAAGVLGSLGVNLEKVRTQTIQVLNQESRSASTELGTHRPMPNVERLTHIKADMQQTFRIGSSDPEEALEAAQGRAYRWLAPSVSCWLRLPGSKRSCEDYRSLRARPLDGGTCSSERGARPHERRVFLT